MDIINSATRDADSNIVRDDLVIIIIVQLASNHNAGINEKCYVVQSYKGLCGSRSDLTLNQSDISIKSICYIGSDCVDPCIYATLDQIV